MSPALAPVFAPVIAIDGPAAAGKGTLARRLAAHLGLPYLDTGLLYRSVAARHLDTRHLDTGDDPLDIARTLTAADLARTDLRRPAIDAAASALAADPAIRAALLAYQRDFALAQGAVLDGRDIGTVIFPEAQVKLFVTASLAARAERRRLELASRGITEPLAVVEAAMAARDAADAARSTAPLKPAPDAILLDTTNLTADEAFEAAKAIIGRQGLCP